MAIVSRSILKPALVSLSLAGALMLGTSQPAWSFGVTVCEDPGTDGLTSILAASIDGTTDAVWDADAEIQIQGDEIVTELDADTTLEMGAYIPLLTKIDTDLQLLGGTSTNNATLQASLAAKGTDAANAAAHVKSMQEEQSHLQQKFSAGAASFQDGNLCAQVSGQSGSSAMENAIAVDASYYNPYIASVESPVLNLPTSVYTGVSSSGGPCTTCFGASSGVPSPAAGITDENSPRSLSSRIHDIATAAALFQPGTGNNGKPLPSTVGGVTVNDTTTPVTGLDTDAYTLSNQLTYSDAYEMAHSMFANYLAGQPPQIVSNAPSFVANKAVYDPALVAYKSRLAVYNLATEAIKKEDAYHKAVNSDSANSIAAAFKDAGYATNLVSFQGMSSPEALDEYLYQLPAEDPTFAQRFKTMDTNSLLTYIADEMLMLNRMEFKSYLQQMEMYKVESEQLVLQNATFDHSQNP